MGVRGLQSFVKQHSLSKTIDDLLNPAFKKQAIGIDISYYIYKWQGDVEKIVDFIKTLYKNNHRVSFDFVWRRKIFKFVVSLRNAIKVPLGGFRGLSS
jgi:hypothetical protein